MIDASLIPAELRAREQWVLWRLEERDGKPTKVPYSARGGRASVDDPGTWANFDDVLLIAETYTGVGYVFTADDPYTGIDMDDCIVGDGLLHPKAQQIVDVLDSWTELSPSGTGVKVIVGASKNGHPRCRTRASWGGELEVYDTSRFWTVTGTPLPGTRETIEDRQTQLNAIMRAAFPPPDPAPVFRPALPVDLDDEEIVERAMRAKNGAEFSALWNGDTAAYDGDDSRADLALCSRLSFWVGRDAERIDRLFRSSGLMRSKWERQDYRERTIQAAIASTNDVYEGASNQVRPASDAPGTHPAFSAGGEPKSAGASRVPYVVGTQGRDALGSPPVVDVQEQVLHAEEAQAFANVDEPSAKPLLGDDENTLLAAGGASVYYGDGGAGKTTLGLDRAFHLCAGKDWLGLPVPNPVRVLWIENEGPRGKFRQKVRAKLETWDGPELEGRLHVLESPWARFTFADEQMRAELVGLITKLEIDVLVAGPVARLGAKGGGTPEEIQAFVDLLEQVRADLGRPLAYELIHHENKQGNVSGAWEGATDTLAHVQARGNGHTAIVWRKVRWAPELHGQTWKLEWRDGERFERDDSPETTDEDFADKLLALVRETPGQSWRKYDPLLTGRQATRKREIRDELLADGKLVNAGGKSGMKLYLPEQVTETLLDAEDGEQAA